MRKFHTRRRAPLAGIICAAVLAAFVGSRAHAISWQGNDDWSGSWDTTVSYGEGWRVAKPDCRLIGMADGGCGYSPNIDNGDLNYLGRSVYSKVAKGVTEVSANYKDRGGIFVRADGLYDFEVMNEDTDRTPLSNEAKNLVGSYTRLLDAFGFWRFNMLAMPSELRVGQQVISWGESTFIQGGLNEVNHFDVSALRVPGAELKEALLPDDMIVFNTQITQNLSAQALYLLAWHETLPEPAGSYFSTNDYATPGGNRVVLGFGQLSDQGTNFQPLGGSFIPDFQNINRLPDKKPSQSGQWGVNFKLYLPDFSQGTQFGVYFLDYSSRLPVVSSITGTQAGLGNGFGAISAAGAAAQAIAAGLPFAAAVATGAAVGQQRAASLGGSLSNALANEYATIGANTLLSGGNVAAQAQSLGTYEYGKTAGYFDEFPQDIQMIGLSFNTQVQKTGTALQGEVAYRHHVPLQVDDVELLDASLTPFESGVATLLNEPVSTPGHCQPTSATPVTGCSQLGAYKLATVIPGYVLKDTWQAQVTATQIFANVLKASQAVILVEAAVDYVPALENKYSGGPVGLGLRYEAPGTNLSGNPQLGSYPQYPGLYEPGSAFPTTTSWGYVVAGRLEYDNLIASWNILPHATWSQDVNGITPGPGGNFIAGRYALTLGIGASLRSKWDLDVSYTQYGGAGQYNLLNDRDFMTASIKYSF